MVSTEPLPCVQGGLRKQIALHLPVAPLCNVHCGYCQPGGACVHHSTRHSSSKLLTAEQAVDYALESLRREPRIGRVGVSGPGDPLASAALTFATFSALREALPEMPFFIVTNGLEVEEHAVPLVEVGVSLCVVTINSLDPDTVGRLVEWVRGPDGVVTGASAAQLLIDRQLAGVRALSSQGVSVRVNFQLLPGVNDAEVKSVAAAVKQAGAAFFQVIPFEPPSSPGPFATIPAPDSRSLEVARTGAAEHLTLLPSCATCAGDSVGCGADVKHEELRSALEASSRKRDSTIPQPASPVSSAPLAERAIALPQLQLVARVARWLAVSEKDTLTTLGQVLVWLDEHLGLKRAVIALADASGEAVQAQVTHGIDPEQVERMRYRLDEGVTGQVFGKGESVLLPHLGAHPEFLDRSGARRDLDLSELAFFCVPILDRGTVLGTLSADKDNRQLKDADADLRLLEEIAQLLAPFVQRQRLEESLALFRRLRSTEGPFARLLGRSPAMDEIRRLIAKVAPANTSVLITGETGTGKSAAATLVHELSPRADGPFIEVNCGAIPESLIESELFGHEKGAFTGALKQRLGVFERARGGTVFLDEIGELQPSAQTRLLRVLQTRQFERVGGTQTLTTDVRLIAATNKDLWSATVEGSFRSDLYYRLNVFPIQMPPLRERGKADLMLLADRFADHHGRAMSKPIFRIDTPAIDMITAYHWPGNVRELENVIERAVVLAEGEVIHGHHLPPSLQMNRYADTPENLDFSTRVQNFETELITEALKDCSGNQTRAAEQLGITKRMIQYKIRNYGIPWQRFVPRT